MHVSPRSSRSLGHVHGLIRAYLRPSAIAELRTPRMHFEVLVVVGESSSRATGVCVRGGGMFLCRSLVRLKHSRQQPLTDRPSHLTLPSSRLKTFVRFAFFTGPRQPPAPAAVPS